MRRIGDVGIGRIGVGVPPHAGRVLLATLVRNTYLTPADARAPALELQAAAERIDPMPPPRPGRGPRTKGRR